MAYGVTAYGTVGYGTTISVALPLTFGRPPAPVAIEALDAQGRVFGKDLLFDGNTRLTASGDYVTVEGRAAARQAILYRLLTRPGEFKARPQYGVGLPSFVKKRNRPAQLQELDRSIRDQLSLESRIEEVIDVVTENIEGDTGGIRVAIKVRISGQIVTFSPFDFTEATQGGISNIR